MQAVRAVAPEFDPLGHRRDSRANAAGAARPRLRTAPASPRSAARRSRGCRAGATGPRPRRRAANRARASRNRRRPRRRATRSTGPSMRTWRRSDFQWNSSAARGLAASSAPLRCRRWCRRRSRRARGPSAAPSAPTAGPSRRRWPAPSLRDRSARRPRLGEPLSNRLSGSVCHAWRRLGLEPVRAATHLVRRVSVPAWERHGSGPLLNAWD